MLLCHRQIQSSHMVAQKFSVVHSDRTNRVWILCLCFSPSLWCISSKRIYVDGCRYNKRLNSETGVSRPPHIHWVVSKHTVNLVLKVIQQETVGLTRHLRNQSTWMYVIVTRVRVGRVLCGRGLRVQVDERYLGCHVHVEVSRTIQPEVGDSGT